MTPGDSPRVTLVVAMYNEAEVLDELVERVESAAARLEGGFEMVAVDDGSTDDTWRLLGEAAGARAWLRGVKLEGNSGQHPATLAGLKHARGEIILSMDADLQVFPEDIPVLVGEIDCGADVVFAARSHAGEGFIRGKVGRWMNRFLARWAFGRPPSSISTFFAARREVVEKALEVERSRPVTAYHLMLAGPGRVSSVTVRNVPRERGLSKYGLWRLVCLTANIVFGYTSLPRFGVAAALVALVAGVVLMSLGAKGVATLPWIAAAVFGAAGACTLAFLLGAFAFRAARRKSRPLYRVETTL